MHPLLVRQLREAGLEAGAPPADSQAWGEFLHRVDRAYQAAGQKIQSAHHHSSPDHATAASILDSLGDGVCAFDQGGGIILLNPAARNLLELGAETPDPRDLLTRFHIRDPWQPEQPLSPEGLLEILTQGGVLRDGDAHLSLDDKRQLPVSCVISPLVKGQHVRGSVLVFRDNSTQKNIERDLLRAKETAEKASEAKSDFLSAMSHELRTPMNAILGYAELLHEDIGESLEEDDAPDYLEDLVYYTDHILEAGRNLLELINQVLDLSRIETGKIEISAEKVDLVHTVAECLEQMEGDIKQAGLELENRLRDHPAIQILADQHRLKQVILNLLSNAVKFNREKGRITLECSDDTGHDGCVRLLIRDTGIGMDEEQQSQIFKPFVRMSGKNLSKGTGVGLTVARELLDIMDGRIGVASEPEVGSTFWIELPGVPTETPVPAGNNTGRKYLLLYVEDSRTNVSLVTKILRVRPDIGFISAPTGELGVELARAHRPDIILLDINLPGIDGFEVLRRLRTFQETRDIPVLGLSADDSDEALAQAKAAGFLHYIVKPLEKEAFLRNLEKALD